MQITLTVKQLRTLADSIPQYLEDDRKLMIVETDTELKLLRPLTDDGKNNQLLAWIENSL